MAAWNTKRKTTKKRKQTKKQQVQVPFPVVLANVLVLVAVLGLSYMWLCSRCHALGKEIKVKERELREAMSGSCGTPLSVTIAQKHDLRSMRQIGLVLDKAQEALNTQVPVNPTMVLDWVATRMI